MAMGLYLSIIILYVNGLEAPTKRQRLAEWIQKQDPYICCLQETHLKTRDTYRLKVKGWKNMFHTNRDQKKAGVAIHISDKIDFEINEAERKKELKEMRTTSKTSGTILIVPTFESQESEKKTKRKAMRNYLRR